MAMRMNKSFAALDAGLLARKGQARPAARAPLDAGWGDSQADQSAEIVPLHPLARVASPARTQQLLLAAQLAAQSDDSAQAGKRAAFTVRLDPERHRKLRLIAATTNLSAQALVIAALDQMLAEFGDVD
jgi:hypothetical protein